MPGSTSGTGPATFVILRLHGMSTLLTRHTRIVPRSRIDGVIDSTALEPGGVHYGIVLRLQGFTRTQVEDIALDWSATYGDSIQTLASQPAEVVLRGRFAVRDVRSPVVNLLVRFQQALGTPWVSSHEGVLTLAAPAPDPSLALGAADVLRRDLAAHSLEAGVEVRRLTATESAHWGAVSSLVDRLAGPQGSAQP